MAAVSGNEKRLEQLRRGAKPDFEEFAPGGRCEDCGKECASCRERYRKKWGRGENK